VDKPGAEDTKAPQKKGALRKLKKQKTVAKPTFLAGPGLYLARYGGLSLSGLTTTM